MTRRRSWTVRAGDPERLDRLLAALGDDDALGDGRVFVDGRRARQPELALAPGMRVEVYAARSADEPVRVLSERAGLIAAYKPAAIASEPDRQGARGTLLHEVARLLAVPVRELHALSRLDVGVSGVALLARGPARPAQLDKLYLGIAPLPGEAQGTWQGAIRARGRELAATTRFRVAARAGSAALLALEPITGRTHQLREHAARAGAPLFGDRARGGAPRVVRSDGSVLELERIALHALRIRVTEASGGRWQVWAPVPESFARIWAALGGSPEALEALCGEAWP